MSNSQRLPLPGEKPSGVWRPRQRKTPPSWQRPRRGGKPLLRRMLPLIGVLALIVIGIAIWRLTARPVTVVVNGQPIALSTHRRTVGGAVRAAGVRLDDTLFLDPSADTRLEPGMVITVAHRRPVIVHLGDEMVIGASHQVEPHAILQEMGIALGPGDALRVERAARPAGPEVAADAALSGVPPLPREIRVVRPVRVIVNQGGERVAFETTAPTLGRALAEAGYALYEADHYSLPLETSLDNVPPEGIEVALDQALPVAVRADGETLFARTHQGSVDALLDELGLAAAGGDYVLPALDAPLSAGLGVQIIRVREEVLDEIIPVPFETIYVPDPDLELDQQRVVRAGQDGQTTRRVRVRTEDGVEVSRAVEGEWVSHHPEAEVIAYGTRIVIRTLNTPSGTLSYWRTLHVLATSYSPSTAGDKKPGDARFGLSATGDVVVRGIIAVDPRTIALYTYMYVPDYGTGRALDVGGAVKGMRIDLGYADEYMVYWNNWVDIYLLVPVPPPDEMIWVLPQ